MPFLQVNLDDRADIEAGISMLMARRLPVTITAQTSAADRDEILAQAMTEMKAKKLWRFLVRVAGLNEPEYSLPELGKLIGLSTNKVCSLKAILAKPEQRLGIQFFEPTSSGAVDTAGNPRYRMPAPIRYAIQNA
jgi:hypothetical protein